MKGLAFGLGEGCGIVGGVSEGGGFQEESWRGEMVGREALAEEGGTEGASFAGVRLHQGLKGGGQVAHAQAKVPRQFAIGDGLACRREGSEADFKR